ncbi:MAG: hypothetical protein Q9159_005343 [Coniocarpon cinnabarinum]
MHVFDVEITAADAVQKGGFEDDGVTPAAPYGYNRDGKPKEKLVKPSEAQKAAARDHVKRNRPFGVQDSGKPYFHPPRQRASAAPVREKQERSLASEPDLRLDVPNHAVDVARVRRDTHREPAKAIAGADVHHQRAESMKAPTIHPASGASLVVEIGDERAAEAAAGKTDIDAVEGSHTDSWTRPKSGCGWGTLA